jgi:hypothetical protein
MVPATIVVESKGAAEIMASSQIFVQFQIDTQSGIGGLLS